MKEEILQCTGCGSLMSDEELAAAKVQDPKIRACCPDRNMQPLKSVVVPFGWRVVPCEPTTDMIWAGHDGYTESKDSWSLCIPSPMKLAYWRMIKAAPELP